MHHSLVKKRGEVCDARAHTTRRRKGQGWGASGVCARARVGSVCPNNNNNNNSNNYNYNYNYNYNCNYNNNNNINNTEHN